MSYSRNLPLISLPKSKKSPSSCRNPSSLRPSVNEESLEAFALAAKYEQIRGQQGNDGKLRKIFGRLMKLIRGSLCDKFGVEIGMRLNEIADRLVYLFETKNEDLCQNSKLHSHPTPEYKLFIYQCMRADQHAWNIERNEINAQIERTNARINQLHDSWNDKLKAQHVIHLNEKLRLTELLQKSESNNLREDLQQQTAIPTEAPKKHKKRDPNWVRAREPAQKWCCQGTNKIANRPD